MSRLGSHGRRDIGLARYHAIPRDVLSNDARPDFQLLRLRADITRRIALGDSARLGDRIVWHVFRFVVLTVHLINDSHQPKRFVCHCF